eukprot:CAMPEP_0119534536 /NCGR_PEP_ID=MMETSP1344-20130328/47749_1 /TAXON_ID=236787 /ORGANISM="Florenciella parvula, Strain CCMP2471" /LENGTH=76 /DNA_ID=CAMNT_0007575823 /DNA_START=100 /DNA_END=330 /DNA_ORIENTATION=+
MARAVRDPSAFLSARLSQPSPHLCPHPRARAPCHWLRPASGFRLPASGFRLPASGFRLPASPTFRASQVRGDGGGD